MNRKKLALYFCVAVVAAMCTLVMVVGGSSAATILTEGFEAGGKSAYAAANVTLGRAAGISMKHLREAPPAIERPDHGRHEFEKPDEFE